MKIKIKMTKRLMIVVCIIVAALSFMGGMIYKYEDYVPIVEYNAIQSKYYIDFKMPVDIETAYMWLDWAIAYHQYFIDKEMFTEQEPLEFLQEYINMYGEIKALFQEFEEEWGQ